MKKRKRKRLGGGEKLIKKEVNNLRGDDGYGN